MPEWNMIISTLNALGLPFLAVGLFILYQSLVRKTEVLAESVDSLRKHHDAFVGIVKSRESQFDSVLAERDNLAELYRKMIQDMGGHSDKIKEAMASTVGTLQEQLARESTQLAECRKLRSELDEANDRLRRELKKIKAVHKDLEDRYEQFVVLKASAK